MLKLSSKIKNICILVFALILGAICCPSIFASKNVAYAYSENNYVFTDYHIDVEYDLKNRAHITENITVKFGDYSNGPHKGIVRAIPKTTTISKGAVSEKYHQMLSVKIYDIKANELYDHYLDDSLYCIELGGDDYVNGQTKQYTLSYIVDIGDDFTRDLDFVYYNVFGTDYPVEIHNASFTVTLPKQTSSEFLCYVGTKNIQNLNAGVSKTMFEDGRVKYSLNEGVLLNAHNGISVKCVLEEGYFSDLNELVRVHDNINTILIVCACVFSAILLGLFVMFAVIRKNTVVTVEFYPPDDLTPPDAKYLLDGVCRGETMASLFVYWASKGLVKIELDDDKKPKLVRKVQNIPEHYSSYEKIMFNKLFENADFVDVKQHNEEAARTISSASGLVKNKIGQRYSKRSLSTKLMSCLFGMLFLIGVIIVELYVSRCNIAAVVCYVVSCVCVVAAGVLINIMSNTKNNTSKRLKKAIIAAILIVLFVVGNIVFSYISCLHFAARVLGFLPLLIAIGLNHLAEEYGDNCREMVGRVIGFRRTLEMVEKDKLIKLVDDDPEYFYNILPYAYAFGITRKFVKKFEGLTIPYNENFGGQVDLVYLMCLHSTFHDISRVPSSYSGSGFGGGGGGVGGGFGGGGSYGR